MVRTSTRFLLPRGPCTVRFYIGAEEKRFDVGQGLLLNCSPIFKFVLNTRGSRFDAVRDEALRSIPHGKFERVSDGYVLCHESCSPETFEHLVEYLNKHRLPKMGVSFDGARRLFKFADLIKAERLQIELARRFRHFTSQYRGVSVTDADMIRRQLFGTDFYVECIENLARRIEEQNLDSVEEMEMAVMRQQHPVVDRDLEERRDAKEWAHGLDNEELTSFLRDQYLSSTFAAAVKNEYEQRTRPLRASMRSPSRSSGAARRRRRKYLQRARDPRPAQRIIKVEEQEVSYLGRHRVLDPTSTSSSNTNPTSWLGHYPVSRPDELVHTEW